MKQFLKQLRLWLSKLSPRTGLIVGAIAALCYAAAFGQILLPISATAKWWLWFGFYGMAKTCQYGALAILGKSGLAELKRRFRRRKAATDIE